MGVAEIFAKVVILLVGVSAILMAADAIRRTLKIKRDGVSVRATVIDNIHRVARGAGKGIRFYPVLEFQAGSKLVRTEGSGTPIVRYPVGTVLEIRYNPGKPEQILVGEPKLAGFVLLIIIGAACIAAGVLALTGVIEVL